MHLHLTNMYCIISCCTLKYMCVLLFRWGCVCVFTYVFLRAFARWWKVTVSFVISVCPTGWNNSAPTGWIFTKFYILVFFWKSVKIQVSLKSDKNKWFFTWRSVYILIISHSFLLRLRSVSDKYFREKHIFCSIVFFLLCCLWHGVEKYCRVGHATDGRMAHAHCMLET